MTTATEFRCVCCKTDMPVEEMSVDPKCHGWCMECDDYEKEACRRDEENDRDGWDDYGPGGIYEDPAVTYERERGEAFQDRLDMWRREY